MNSIKIEIAGEQDSEVIREIYQTAFPEEESAMVAKLAVDLLAEKTVPEILSLVAREIETTLGHVAFSPVKVENNESCKASILAPLAVHPEHQQKKVGSRLIEFGIEKLEEAAKPSYYFKPLNVKEANSSQKSSLNKLIRDVVGDILRDIWLKRNAWK